jgi:hypothetical protein
VEERLVVLEPYIQAGLLLFYQVAFQYQSLDLVVCQYEIKFGGQSPDQPYFGIFQVRTLKIGFNPVFKISGFTNIDN